MIDLTADGVHDGVRVEELTRRVFMLTRVPKQRPARMDRGRHDQGQDRAVRSGSPETRNVDHVALAILRSQAGQVRLVQWLWHGNYCKYSRSFVVQIRYEVERQRALVTERKVLSGTEGEYH